MPDFAHLAIALCRCSIGEHGLVVGWPNRQHVARLIPRASQGYGALRLICRHLAER